MSSVTIVILIFIAIAALLFIGYINQLIEKTSLEKARLKADLLDRYRRCGILSEALPGQLMSVELKQLLNRLELHFVEQLSTIDSQEAKYKLREEELRQSIAEADELRIKNLPVTIISDQQAKDVRFQLESLQAQIIRAVEEKLLPGAEGKYWLGQLKHMLVTVYIDYFNNSGRQFLEQDNTAQARLMFERAIQYLKKQNDAALYKQPMAQFESLLARTNASMLEGSNPSSEQISELTEGLELQDQENEWKKKHIYD
ncbi:hypothetical protein [Denitrificimonas caeni]|uniref:hypothetical protein n=1 Tax=Denitrificimonas caeni TaxID=521720 RepID=UPI0019641293|nr:hypothetical protein [Denitrificimonas caeni]